MNQFGGERHSVRAGVAQPLDEEIMASIETRAASWTAVALHRFSTNRRQSNFTKHPPQL
jgi:hypothetical protein